MICRYHILNVSALGERTVAILPLRAVLGSEQRFLLREDFQRLAEETTKEIELDLSSVESTDGSFFTELMGLRRTLVERSARLTLRVAPSLKQVLEVTRLDQIFVLLER